MENAEYKITKNGRKFFSLEAKKKILGELDNGKSPAEISREYGVPIRYFQAWKSSFLVAGAIGLKSNDEVVPWSQYKKILEDKRKLERALGKKIMECEILKDAVEIASKKSGFSQKDDLYEKV